ncbi:hypothetical protein BU15DRAFT_70295 [Melanogaster broomeanus]|nr:hypothetical protein BU15DRAFT_70295 [Melanogaster broomeanus]
MHPQHVAGVNGAPVGSNVGVTDPTAPFRLYDCENQILKDQQTYLRETNNVAPPYLVVSQVWGNIQEQMSLLTIEWPVPISSKAKWDAILRYCRNENIKWLWMDILCINQSANSEEANREKDAEIPKMGEYYRGSFACLVVPEDYTLFSTAHKHVMHLFRTIVSTNALVKDNAAVIWECIAHVDAMMSDQYFWRMWTFQELLLPAKHVLLDGQELRTSSLKSVLEWYYKILRNGSLKRPSGGREYSFIKPENETVISKNWEPTKMGWGLKEELDQKGHVDLISLVSQTRDKSCKFDVDRLLGLYGLLCNDEQVPIETTTTLQKATQHDKSTHTESSTARLLSIWERTLCKAVTSGKVWPLLHDVILTESEVGSWKPDIRAFHRRGDAIFVRQETLNHSNTGSIRITQDGLHIPVRVVGRVVGASVSIGDGGGEINKLITCTWILKARGFNINPIVQQFKDGLAGSDSVPLGGVDEARRALDMALSAQSLSKCFSVVEHTELRRKLVYAPGVTGWDKMVLAVQIDGRTTPAVCLAWVHSKLHPMKSGCLVLDVTSDPVENVQRWVVANTEGSNKVQKIGTVRSFPGLIEVNSKLTSTDVIFT